MPPIRILHVLDHSLPHLSGYAVRSHYLLRSQRQLSLRPIALTSPKHGSDTAGAEIDGISYLRTPPAPRSTALAGIGEFQLMLRLARRLAEVVREQDIQLVHAHSPVLNGIPALWVARRTGIPVVYEIRAFWEDAAVDHGTHREASLRYRTIRALETWLTRRVDAVGVISEGLAREVIARGISPDKVFRVPNGVDTELFHPAARDFELEHRWGLKGKVVIGFIGSFYRYEGLDLLVQAFANLAAACPQACLLLVGAGETADSLRTEVQRLGLESRIVFAGPVPHADIGRYYSVCDVLVYPRKSMRLTELVTPLKPLEAMAAGKAVVGSDVGGLRELIRDHETGMLFAASDPDDLARVLTVLVGRPELRNALGANARACVGCEREWKTLARVYEQTYAVLTNGCATQHS